MSTKDSNVKERFPFLTIFQYGGEEYIGIVQNVSKTLASVYVFNYLHTNEMKRRFLELGDVWWSESNRKIPINLFIKQDFNQFECILKHYITKEFKIIKGPAVNLQSLNSKRVKRKRIELVFDTD